MNYKQSFFGLAVGTALLLAVGCSKQESPASSAADTATSRPAPMASEQQKAAEVPKPANTQPPAPAEAEPVAASSPAVAAAPAATPVTAPAASLNPVQPPKPATDQSVAATPVASGGGTTGTPAGALQSATQSAQLSLAQAATNRALTALEATNQVALAATNGVQALMERARSLTSNQKYQAALDTLTQLYETKLTPEQKQKADDLKNQIQTALAQKAASEATSVLGNILGGKKQ